MDKIHVEELIPEYIEIEAPKEVAPDTDGINVEEWFVEHYDYDDEFFVTGEKK